MSLDFQSSRCGVVIDYATSNPINTNIIENCIIERLQRLSSSGIDYFFIVHNKDRDSEDNHIRNHIHLVVRSVTRKRGKTWLNLIADLIQRPLESIQIQQIDSLEGSIQYLIHKNDVDKAPYEVEDIYTNVSERVLKNFINLDLSCNELSFDILEDIYISSGCNVYLFMKAIGVNKYHGYRNTIQDFLKYGVPELERRQFKERQRIINEEALKTL